GGQQRRVDVQHPSRVALHEIGAQNAHEAGEHDEIGLARVDRFAERGIEGGARRECAMVDDRGCNAVSLGMREPRRIRAIADDVRDRALELGHIRRIDQRSEIRSAPGDENGDSRERHQTTIVCGAPSGRATTSPMSYAVSPDCESEAIVAATSPGATASTMPMPQLKTR